MTGIRHPILLVEDSENDIELTLIALERGGIRNPVHVARDGVQAMEFLRRAGKWADREDEHPVLVILDKKLPRLDGHEVIEQVKGDPALRGIPLVMLTSSRHEADLLRSYDLGVNAYVVKPLKFDDFMEAIGDMGAFWIDHNTLRPRGFLAGE